MNGMDKSSTQRVQRFRLRQHDAGNRRITLYLDQETQRKLDQLAGDKAQAGYLEAIVKTAIEREWAALAIQRKGNQPRQSVLNPALFSGRRRSFAEK